jgi:hypothetical protein
VFTNFSKQSWSYLKIPGARRLTWNRFHNDIPQILVATATCRPVLCTPVIRDILYILLLFCCLHISCFPFQLDYPLFIINVSYSLCLLGISFLPPFLLRYSFLFSLLSFGCVPSWKYLSKISGNMRAFRRPPRWKWDLRSSEKRRNVNW